MKKILHVDDDEALLRMVSRYLQGHGYAVVTTTSPFVAPVIVAEKPDLIVMDVDMPLLPGDRIVEILRGKDFSSLPVIFFSSKSAPELLSITRKAARSSYIRKEEGLPALLAKINSLVGV